MTKLTTPPSSSSSSTSSSTLRTRLPSSSPSSARLRRIAPSPVKIPKLSSSSSSSSPCAHGRTTTSGRKLNNNHTALSNLSNSPSPKSTSSRHKGKDITKEYDFAPLELVILSSPDTQIRTLFQVLESSKTNSYISSTNNGRRKKSSKDFNNDESKLPLIFDSKGEFGKLAYEASLREFKEIDIPSSYDSENDCFEDELNEEFIFNSISPIKKRKSNPQYQGQVEKNTTSKPRRRSGITLLTPSQYLKKIDFLPSPILINFRQDIFNEKGHEEIRSQDKPKESTPRYSTPTITKPKAEGTGRLEREDRSESFNTFGHGSISTNQDLSILTDKQDEFEVEQKLNPDLDKWRFTLSAYGESSSDTEIFRKDSFFANTTFDSTNNSSIDLTLNTPSTLDISLNPHAIKEESSYTPPSESSSPSINSKPGLSISDEFQTQDDSPSPYSDTIITPQPTIKTKLWRSSKSDLLLNVINDDEINDTPTPKNSKLTIRPRSRLISIEKKLPSLPTEEPQAEHAENGAKKGEQVTTEESNDIEKALKDVDRNMTIQLWVDQEGCRETRSSLKFIRSIKPCVFREREETSLQQAALWCESPTRPESFQQSGCWEFGMEPKERDKWMFHQAALEGLPVLRRLNINNDDKFDFLSRGATLQIKEPGVYSVCGQEERGKSEWKFEYLVQNKVSLNSGEQIANERIVVPLAFYISPNFFSPDRALKTSLLNLFKKTLASNIMSEKVRPPHIGKPPSKPISDPLPAPEPKAIKIEVEVQQNGRKRAQTQSHTLLGHGEPPIAKPTVAATPSHTHSRSVSKTIGAFAKAVVGMSSTTPTHQLNHNTSKPATPIGNNNDSNIRPSSGGIHKFGSKTPSFGRSALGSRSKTPTTSEFPTEITSLSGNTPGELNGEDKKKGRKRATSLFSRSRPFTPPVNITELHPIPIISNSNPTSSNSTSTGNGIKCSTPPSIGNGISNLNRTSTLGLPVPNNNNNHTSISLPLNQNNSIPINPTKYHRLSQQHHPFLHPNTASSSASLNNNGIYNNNISPVPSFSSSINSNSDSNLIILTPVIKPLLSRSSSITSRSKPIINTQTQNEERDIMGNGQVLGLTGMGNGKGLIPAPPRRGGMRKRPSTAEPRLGMR